MSKLNTNVFTPQSYQHSVFFVTQSKHHRQIFTPKLKLHIHIFLQKQNSILIFSPPSQNSTLLFQLSSQNSIYLPTLNLWTLCLCTVCLGSVPNLKACHWRNARALAVLSLVSMLWRHTEAILAPVSPVEVYRDYWSADMYSNTSGPSIVCVLNMCTHCLIPH